MLIRKLIPVDKILLQDLVKRFQEKAKETDFLQEQQEKNLQLDVETVLSTIKQTRTLTKNKSDQTRVLGVVAATKGAEKYLPYTVPKIITQISETGMGADIIIGLNHGYECETVIGHFKLFMDVQIIHLYTDEKVASTAIAKIFDNPECKGSPYYLSQIYPSAARHRIFVIHQREGLYTSGKIRILADIYRGLLLQSIDHGWIPPAILVTFDAESQFLVNRKRTTVNTESNGLKLMIEKMQKNPEIDILGANNRYVVYSQSSIAGIEVLLPNFNTDVPPIPWCLNIFHGRYAGYNFKPGGGTIVKTDVMIGLLTAITKRYPGSRVEDIHLSILGKHSGLKGEICMDAFAVNKVPSSTDLTTDIPKKLAWTEQMYRWMAGIQALELNYGQKNIKTIIYNRFPWHILINPIKFYQIVIETETINFYVLYKVSKTVLLALITLKHLQKKALESPDILQGAEAKANW